MFEGKNYRVLVVGGKMVAASERVPCGVTGDGKHTIAELVEDVFANGRRLIKDGKFSFKAKFLEESNRRIELRGEK